MGKLFEVLRRLLLASMYIAGSILIAVMIKNGWHFHTAHISSPNDSYVERMLYFYGIAVALFIALPIAHKLINWILLKD